MNLQRQIACELGPIKLRNGQVYNGRLLVDLDQSSAGMMNLQRQIACDFELTAIRVSEPLIDDGQPATDQALHVHTGSAVRGPGAVVIRPFTGPIRAFKAHRGWLERRVEHSQRCRPFF